MTTIDNPDLILPCPCQGRPIHRIAVRVEDVGQVRDAIRRGGRVRVGQLEMGD